MLFLVQQFSILFCIAHNCEDILILWRDLLIAHNFLERLSSDLVWLKLAANGEVVVLVEYPCSLQEILLFVFHIWRSCRSFH